MVERWLKKWSSHLLYNLTDCLTIMCISNKFQVQCSNTNWAMKPLRIEQVNLLGSCISVRGMMSGISFTYHCFRRNRCTYETTVTSHGKTYTNVLTLKGLKCQLAVSHRQSAVSNPLVNVRRFHQTVRRFCQTVRRIHQTVRRIQQHCWDCLARIISPILMLHCLQIVTHHF